MPFDFDVAREKVAQGFARSGFGHADAVSALAQHWPGVGLDWGWTSEALLLKIP